MMKTIEHAAEYLALFLQVMQLNADSESDVEYEFRSSGLANTIEIIKHEKSEPVKYLTHYIGEDFGSTLDDMFGFIKDEYKNICTDAAKAGEIPQKGTHSDDASDVQERETVRYRKLLRCTRCKNELWNDEPIERFDPNEGRYDVCPICGKPTSFTEVFTLGFGGEIYDSLDELIKNVGEELEYEEI